jgi:hypothetical protein
MAATATRSPSSSKAPSRPSTKTSTDAAVRKAPKIGDDEPQQAAKESVGNMDVDMSHLEEMREAAEAQQARLGRKNDKFLERLDRRHALRDGEDAVKDQADVRKREAKRLADQQDAFEKAQERARQWIAPEPVKGRMKGVKLLLHPEEKVRKHTIHLRALGEVPDGFIMVFEDPADPADLKQGRIAESERFGTKNRVRIDEVDPKTGKVSGEHTHPGYKDFGPLRLNPGSYRAVVVTTDDKVLAEEKFEIVPDWNEDGQSDQVTGTRAPKYLTSKPEAKDSPRESSIAKVDPEKLSLTQSEEQRAAMAAEQVARDAAKSAGEDVPPAPSSDGIKTDSETKEVRKDSPEGRAQ